MITHTDTDTHTHTRTHTDQVHNQPPRSNVVVTFYKEQENVSTDRAEKRLQQTQNVRSVH